jgi:heat shock protein HslJ
MSKLARLKHLLPAMVLLLPALALAADVASPPTPNGSGADPALVRSLQDHLWTLKSGVEAGGEPIEGLVVPGNSFVMRFEGARVAVQGGCNNVVGSWRMSPDGQLIVGRLAGTLKACSPALMKADATISAVLAQQLDVQLQSGDTTSLRLVTATRQALAFEGRPTMESRYGEPTRIFLEVAPQTVACTRGVVQTQCLQVRERRFDDAGLKVGTPGEWQIFHDTIEGYTHTPGERNVLRIRRYERSPVPADASAYVHVLDLVVETEKTSTVE